MAQTRAYPTNAAHGGTATLTGAGSDVFTFSTPIKAIVQNNTAATIYVSCGVGSSAAATQGDEAVPAGAEFTSDEIASWVAIYGAASIKVNGPASGQIVLYGLNWP